MITLDFAGLRLNVSASASGEPAPWRVLLRRHEQVTGPVRRLLGGGRRLRVRGKGEGVRT